MSDNRMAYQIQEYMSVVVDHSKYFCWHLILCKTHHHCHNRHHQPTRTLHHPVRWCFPVTYDKDIDLLTRPWLLWPAACYRKHCGCLVFRNACEEIPTEKKLTVLISDVVRRCPMLKVKHPLKWFYDAPNLSGVHRKCIEILDSVWVQFQ